MLKYMNWKYQRRKLITKVAIKIFVLKENVKFRYVGWKVIEVGISSFNHKIADYTVKNLEIHIRRIKLHVAAIPNVQKNERLINV